MEDLERLIHLGQLEYGQMADCEFLFIRHKINHKISN